MIVSDFMTDFVSNIFMPLPESKDNPIHCISHFLLKYAFYFPESKDKRCFTPIHCASLTGNADCISRLLDGGSEVNSRGFAGATPLHITVCYYSEALYFVLCFHIHVQCGGLVVDC